MVKQQFLDQASKSSLNAKMHIYGADDVVDINYVISGENDITMIGYFKDLRKFLSNNPENLKSKILFSEETIYEIKQIVTDFDNGLVLKYLNHQSIPCLNPWSLDNLSETLTEKLGGLGKAHGEISDMINDFTALVDKQDMRMRFGYTHNLSIGFFAY